MDRTYDSVVCAGMDVHHKFSQVTFRDGEAAVVRRERVDHQDRAALRRQLSGWPRGLTVVMESSFGWGWLSDVLLALGLCPRLSDCFKVSKKREALGWAKTNKKDADLLSLLPFEATPWWETWLAPPAVRQCREWMRFRTDLTQVGTETKNRIHAVLHRYGIFHDFSDLFGGGGRRFLAELCAGEHVVLPPGALWALQGYVMLLNQVRCQLAPLEQRLRSRLEATPEVRLIKTIPGFGVILSHTVHAEVGRIDRFAGQKRLASYCLLAPQASTTRVGRRWVGVWGIVATGR